MSIPLLPEHILGYELYPGQSAACLADPGIMKRDLQHPLVVEAGKRNLAALDAELSEHPDRWEKLDNGDWRSK